VSQCKEISLLPLPPTEKLLNTLRKQSAHLKSPSRRQLPFFYKQEEYRQQLISLLLGITVTSLTTSNSWANGSTQEALPKTDQPVEQHLAGQLQQDLHCSDRGTITSTLNLERATTLVIRDNEILEKLDLSGLENLTTLVIKNSNHLTQLQIPVLSKVKNITIEDNHKLKDIQFHETFYQSNLSSEWITKPSTWVSKLQGIFLTD